MSRYPTHVEPGEFFRALTKAQQWWARSELEPCEGVAASWCWRCGDCICGERDKLNDPNPDCPLHAPGTAHAEGAYAEK